MASKVAFLGLGRMGVHMARRLSDKYAVCGFDIAEASRMAATSQITQVTDVLETAAEGAEFVISSLPVSSVTEQCVDQLLHSGSLKPGATWVDTTSGVPSISERISEKLQTEGVSFLDCGVAGGPKAAETGVLSAMVGGESHNLAKVQPLLDLMMAKVVHIGPVGSGHAVKAVNNTLLATNIWTSYEALLILAKMGVNLEKALEAINASSGRSLVTEERIPRHVLNRKFDFGFSLGLMRKDVEIAMRAINDLDIPSPVLRQIAAFWQIGEASLGKDAEHMEVVKVLEQMTGAKVEASKIVWPRLMESVDAANTYEELDESEAHLEELLSKLKAKKRTLS